LNCSLLATEKRGRKGKVDGQRWKRGKEKERRKRQRIGTKTHSDSDFMVQKNVKFQK
jgi:hypothetical protein